MGNFRNISHDGRGRQKAQIKKIGRWGRLGRDRMSKLQWTDVSMIDEETLFEFESSVIKNIGDDRQTIGGVWRIKI